MLVKYVDFHQTDWDVWTPYMVFAYNTSNQATTHYTPFFLVHGREAEMPMDQAIANPNDEGKEKETIHNEFAIKMKERLEEATKFVHDNIEAAQTRQTESYDSHHKEVNYQVGQQVWLYNPSLLSLQKAKLASP